MRDVRRKLKRESKVQLSDEIIFFDDIAGNKQAKVGGLGTCTGSSVCTKIRLALVLCTCRPCARVPSPGSCHVRTGVSTFTVAHCRHQQ